MSGPPIFISARFRSGSTMLWSLFRGLDGYCAYYEPCHDNLLANLDHTPPLESHRGVESYWTEYLPIRAEVARLHRRELGLERLLLERDDDHPELEAYLRMLIDRARPCTAVLQLNRVDFRLPWLRARFPDARIVHLWRDPRDSWYSAVRHNPPDEWDDPDHPDAYDLALWAYALWDAFPFLVGEDVETSYQRHYYLWRLSERMGKRVADCSLSYDLDFRPRPEVAFDKLVELDPDLAPERARALAAVQPAPARAWAAHRSEAWFEEIERRCDALLERLGLLAELGLKPLAQIAAEHRAAWDELPTGRPRESVAPLLVAFSRLRSSLTVSLDLNRRLESRLPLGQRALRTARHAAGRLRRRLERRLARRGEPPP